MRIWLTVMSCITAWHAPLAAQPAFDWQAPPACPSAEQAREEVVRLLGRLASTIGAGPEIRVRIDAAASGEFEARVQSGASHPRVLRDPRCDVLTRATAVVVALAIDSRSQRERHADDAALAPSPRTVKRARSASPRQVPSVLDSEPPPSLDASTPADPAHTANDEDDEPAPAIETGTFDGKPANRGAALGRVETAPDPTSSSDRDSEPEPASAATRRITAFFALGAGFGVRVLPSLAPTFAATAGIQSDVWRAALHLSYAPPRAASLDTPSGVGGRVALSSAALDAGLRSVLTSLEVPLVAGIEAGFFDARGVGTFDSQLRMPLWLATYLGSGARLTLSSMLALALRLEGVVALRRPRFAVDDGQGSPAVFHRPSLLSARALVELEAHWW